jgi:hypothetical protein
MPSLAEDASKPFTAYPHGRLLNRPRGYLRGIFWSRPASGKILCSRADFHALEKLLEQKETGAGGRCDLFWWGNMAAETDCTELNN